jgi:hypothetical protein
MKNNLTSKKEAFGFGALIQITRNIFNTLKPGIKWWFFKESFKWHINCYLYFWKLPKLLEHSLDALEASESMRAETDKAYEKLDERVEYIMEGVVDNIWADHLFGIKYDNKNYREESSLSDAERKEVHTEIKNKYEQYQVPCPDEYLTQDEAWDRAEIAHENSMLAWSGGPNYDDRPDVVYAAKHFIKKNKIVSKYSGDWGDND